MWWHTVLASAPPGGGDAHGAAPLEVHLPARDAEQAVVAGDAGSAVYGRRLAGRAGADALQAATGGAEPGALGQLQLLSTCLSYGSACVSQLPTKIRQAAVRALTRLVVGSRVILNFARACPYCGRG